MKDRVKLWVYIGACLGITLFPAICLSGLIALALRLNLLHSEPKLWMILVPFGTFIATWLVLSLIVGGCLIWVSRIRDRHASKSFEGMVE